MAKIYKAFVMILSILTVNLLTNYLETITRRYAGNRYGILLGMIITMTIIVVVFYPLFSYMDKWAGAFSRKMLKLGKSIAGRRIGAFIGFLSGILFLFYLYGRFWYNINPLKTLMRMF